VRSTGVGRARISDAPGFSKRAGNSLRLLTEQVPENRVLSCYSRFEFSWAILWRLGKPVIASPHLPVAGTPKQEKARARRPRLIFTF
jgi:hypothetical protein